MKKTSDGRIIDKRIWVDKKLKETITNIKDKKQLSWQKFARVLNVSEQTLYHYWLNGNSTMPYELLEKVLSFDKEVNKSKILKKVQILQPFWGQKLSGGENKSKKITIPNKNSKDFAEFYGVLLGDGCLFSDLKGLSVTADRILDYNYLTEYIDGLIYHLFKLYPKFYFTKNTRTIRCVLYSKNVVKYLSDLGFPIGFKRDIYIPNFILDKKENLIKCLRGLMDTDGSLSAHPHSKIMIHLSITSDSLRKEVFEALRRLEIKSSLFSKGIMIYSKNAIRFCEIIGFSNLKNILKYKFFLKEGRVPKSKEVESFIRAKKF